MKVRQKAPKTLVITLNGIGEPDEECQADKYALALLDALFLVMMNWFLSCYATSKRSR